MEIYCALQESHKSDFVALCLHRITDCQCNNKSNKKAVGVPFFFNEMIDSREIVFKEAIIVRKGRIYEMIVKKVFCFKKMKLRQQTLIRALQDFLF